MWGEKPYCMIMQSGKWFPVNNRGAGEDKEIRALVDTRCTATLITPKLH